MQKKQLKLTNNPFQRWSRGHKARGQGQRHKKIRGQGQPFRGQTLSRPRTGMLEAMAKNQGHKRKCSPKKKKVFTKIFQAISTKKRFPKNFSSAPQNFNNSKNSARGLDLRGQGQGLQNVSSRPRTSSRTPPLILFSVKFFFFGSFFTVIFVILALLSLTDEP